MVSFEPDEGTITIDGERLDPVPGQAVLSHGPGRNPSVGEMGGIQLDQLADSAAASA